MVFVDFNKAFDTVGRTGLWQLLRKYGCTEKFTTMAPALFSIYLSAMLDEAFQDMGVGVVSTYRPIQRCTLQSEDQD